MEIPSQYIKNLYRALLLFLIILSVFFAVQTLSGWKSYGTAGSQNVNTISFSGHGEVTAVPNVANVDFTIRKEAKTVKDAQAAVALVEQASLDFLKTNSVVEKDIKTSNASFNPKYEYRQAICPQIPMGAGTAGITVSPTSPYYCPNGKQVLTGYEAYESIAVKIRNTDDVGKIMQGLGTVGVSELSGPNFSIDNEDLLKTEARKKAIDNAKEKATSLANDLGISLGRIASFNDAGSYPIMYGRNTTMALDSATAPAPAQIPKGENIISSDVTITYEIR